MFLPRVTNGNFWVQEGSSGCDFKKVYFNQSTSIHNYKNEINSNCKHDREKSKQKISSIYRDV